MDVLEPDDTNLIEYVDMATLPLHYQLAITNFKTQIIDKIGVNDVEQLKELLLAVFKLNYGIKHQMSVLIKEGSPFK